MSLLRHSWHLAEVMKEPPKLRQELGSKELELQGLRSQVEQVRDPPREVLTYVLTCFSSMAPWSVAVHRHFTCFDPLDQVGFGGFVGDPSAGWPSCVTCIEDLEALH